MTTTPIRKPVPRKPPAKRAFSGMVGLPPEPENVQKPVPSTLDSQEIRTTAEIVDEVFARVKPTYSKREARTALQIALSETRALPKRGRKPKYATEEERKAADATRKRGERQDKAEAERITDLADRTGTDFKTGPEDALLISKSGGYGAEKIDLIVAHQDTSRLSSPNADTTSDELTTPDRKVTAVPVNPDNAKKDIRETDGQFMRKAGAVLSRWAKGPVKKSCALEHVAFAEKHKDSKRKVYCGKCRKLLVKSGKTCEGGYLSETLPGTSCRSPRGISRTHKLEITN